jgi:transcriptional regulator GlxA family with amidase domain
VNKRPAFVAGEDMNRRPPTRVFIMAYKECDELDVIGPYAVLQAANYELAQRTPPGSSFVVKIVATKGAGAVACTGPDGPLEFITGVHGSSLGVEPWDGTDPPDILIVAGGNTADGTGVRVQARNPAFTAALRAQVAPGRQLVGICTSEIGLAAAGVLDGRTFTAHPAVLDELATDLQKTGARVVNPDWEARVVDDGELITCGGVTAGIDEALYLVQTFWPHDPQLVADVRGFVDFLYRSPVGFGPHYAPAKVAH